MFYELLVRWQRQIEDFLNVLNERALRFTRPQLAMHGDVGGLPVFNELPLFVVLSRAKVP